ncbi:MAG: META domain-containing protein [Litoreibacter sp.]
MIRFTFLALLALAACKDETLSGYGAAETVWHLTSIDGADIAPSVLLTFPSQGEIGGQGPCNSYSATQTAPYPWFAVGDFRSTKTACPDISFENDYFTALKSMTISEISGGTLILSNDAKRTMTFTAQ